MRKTSPFLKRLSLVIIGICIALIALEITLRAAGFALMLQRDYRNRRHLQEKSALTVLCLGESTTFLRYPYLLEQLLNKQSPTRRFKVINKGVVATHTTEILQNLPSYLDTYHPDFVITMIGINDTNPAFIYDDPRSIIVPFSSGRWSWENLRTVKLFRHVVRIAVLKIRFSRVSREHAAPAAQPQPATSYPGGHLSSDDTFNGVLPDTDDYNAWFQRGVAYAERSDIPNAETCFRKCISLEPKNGAPWEELGKIYWDRQRLREAIMPFNRSLALNNNPEVARIYLANIYMQTGQWAAAEQTLRQLPSLHRFIQFRGTMESFTPPEKELLEAVLNGAPDKAYAFIHLSEIAAARGDLDGELKYLEAASRHIGINDRLCGAIAIQHLVRGRREMADTYFNRAEDLRMRYICQLVQENYTQIAREVTQRNSTLISMQYPMRSVNPLRKMLAGFPGVYFADNEKSFKDAVVRDGFSACFEDHFAEDFGHCTEKGDLLVARNAAAVILRCLAANGSNN